jgi:hypothetical protein
MLLFLFVLPFVFGLWIVAAVLKFAFRLTFGLLILPIVLIPVAIALIPVAIAAVIAGIAVGVALLIPLTPLLVVGGVIWLLTRSSRAATASPN